MAMAPQCCGVRRSHRQPQQVARAAAVMCLFGCRRVCFIKWCGREVDPNRHVTRGSKYDWLQWRDDFDGQDKKCEDRGREYLVSGFDYWAQKVLTDMRVGEVRRVIVPAGVSYSRKELYMEYSLLAIL
mmetsp:Transcript_15274/g.36320  ORF Transcript_15274/g.36320 Transcript_15274/m.36320 type:complete len:128 (+) Transcript_15274:165-548(+)